MYDKLFKDKLPQLTLYVVSLLHLTHQVSPNPIDISLPLSSSSFFHCRCIALLHPLTYFLLQTPNPPLPLTPISRRYVETFLSRFISLVSITLCCHGHTSHTESCPSVVS